MDQMPIKAIFCNPIFLFVPNHTISVLIYVYFMNECIIINKEVKMV